MAVSYANLSGRRFPTGWVDDPGSVSEVLGRLRHPVFGVEAKASGISGTGKGKIVRLYAALVKYLGTFPVKTQEIGDCVSMAYAICVDTLKSVQMHVGAKEIFGGETATEPIYAGSRVEIGKGRCGTGDGSIGAWAAECVQEIGTIVRGKYGDIDLTTYSGERAKKWGMPNAGIPNSIEPICLEHPVKTTSMVRSYEEARDSISQGFPIAVCSNQGFTDVRDSEGFAKPKGNWGHAMAFLAVDDQHKRPGLCCVNSWGPSWISGPKRHEQPDGSFWVDAEICDKMLAGGDSFALSAYVGFPKLKVDYSSI